MPAHDRPRVGSRITRQLPRIAAALVAVAGMAAALLPPWIDRCAARRQAEQVVASARRAVTAARHAQRRIAALHCEELQGGQLLQVRQAPASLASWGDIGGCGVGGGGASSTAGGTRWIGRGVTGGLVDVQCIASETFLPGGYFTTINTRLATKLGTKWIVGVSVPLLHKRQQLEVAPGVERTAALSGLGDLGFEITRKLGITNSNMVSLLISAPVGSHDAVRQGIVLPQQMQLGAGVPGATLLFEHARDVDWGLLVLGSSLSYPGWENTVADSTTGLGDYRAPSMSAYTYLGYLLGPFVPSIGLSATVSFAKNRERGQLLEDLPRGLGSASVGIEWSSDWVALLLSAALPFTADGVESGTVSLGVSTSLF